VSTLFFLFVASDRVDEEFRRFRHEALPLLVYGPPALLGVVLYQYFFVSNRLRSPLTTVTQDIAESSLLEHSSLVGLNIYYTTFMLLGHALGVGSSYLFAIGSIGSLAALCVNDYLLQRHQPIHEKGLNLVSYLVGQVLPIMLGVEGIIGFLVSYLSVDSKKSGSHY